MNSFNLAIAPRHLPIFYFGWSAATKRLLDAQLFPHVAGEVLTATVYPFDLDWIHGWWPAQVFLLRVYFNFIAIRNLLNVEWSQTSSGQLLA